MSDRLWELVVPLLPGFGVRRQGADRAPVEERAVFTAVVFVLAGGCAWRQLPACFGVASPTAHRRFTVCPNAGVWPRSRRAVLDHPRAREPIARGEAVVPVAGRTGVRGSGPAGSGRSSQSENEPAAPSVPLRRPRWVTFANRAVEPDRALGTAAHRPRASRLPCRSVVLPELGRVGGDPARAALRSGSRRSRHTPVDPLFATLRRGRGPPAALGEPAEPYKTRKRAVAFWCHRCDNLDPYHGGIRPHTQRSVSRGRCTDGERFSTCNISGNPAMDSGAFGPRNQSTVRGWHRQP
ncbi:transposase [Embleya hyalina]|uniref:transposase n=1 Tax=Embleya hyalina TaxID=516124 RepID=UPI001357E240